MDLKTDVLIAFWSSTANVQTPKLFACLLLTSNTQTAAEGSNRYGNANSMYPVLETYTEGSVLEVRVVVSTTHHVSHKHLFDYAFFMVHDDFAQTYYHVS